MLKRRTNSKAIGYVMSCGVMAWTRPGVIPANDDLELRARVCVPVRWQGELLALIMVVDADGSMTTAETMMVSSVAEQLAPILVTELQTGDQTAEQTVLDLVHDDGALRRAALEKLAAAEASSGDELAVTAIRLSVRDGAVDASQAHIKVALRSALKLPGLTAARFQLGAVGEDGAVLVIGSMRPLSAETTRLHAQHMVARVNDLSSGRFEAVAGIGPSVEGPEPRARDGRAGRTGHSCRSHRADWRRHDLGWIGTVRPAASHTLEPALPSHASGRGAAPPRHRRRRQSREDVASIPGPRRVGSRGIRGPPHPPHDALLPDLADRGASGHRPFRRPYSAEPPHRNQPVGPHSRLPARGRRPAEDVHACPIVRA